MTPALADAIFAKLNKLLSTPSLTRFEIMRMTEIPSVSSKVYCYQKDNVTFLAHINFDGTITIKFVFW